MTPTTAQVSLTLNAAQYFSGMSKVQAEAKAAAANIASSFTAAQGALVAFGGVVAALGIGAAVTGAANYADEMGKLAQRAGESTTEFSKLAYAARQADVDSGELAKALRVLGKDAQTGGEALAKAGISALDSSGNAKTSAQLFRELASVIAGIEDPQKRAAIAAEVLGDKLGPQLIPLLGQGADGLRTMGDEAERFGRVVTDDAVKAAEAFNDNLTKLQEASQGIAAQMAGPVIQSLADASGYFLAVARDVGFARAALISFGAAVARTLGVDDVGQLQSQAKANQNAIALTVKQIETFQRLADRGVAGAADRVAALREQYTQLQRSGSQVSDSLKNIANEAPAPGRPKSSLPELTVGGGKAGKAGRATAARVPKVEDPDAQAKRLLDSLQKQLQATRDLSVEETLLADIQAGRLGNVSGSMKSALVEQAKLLDQTRAQQALDKLTVKIHKDTEAAAERARKEQEQLIKALVDSTPQAALERQRKEVELLDQAFRDGRISAEQLRDVHDMWAEQGKKVKDANDDARQFGQIMTSAFEDAIIEGGKLSDVLKGLAKDLLRLVLRKQVTEPLAQSASGLLGGLFGGGDSGSGLLSSIGNLFSFDGGGWTGDGPRSGGIDGKGGFMAVLHPQERVIDTTKGGSGAGVTVVQNISIDARGADASVDQKIMAAMRQTKQETLAAVQMRANRGGSFAASVGRA